MDFLNKYISIPYKDHGLDFQGVNCWGLLYLIYLTERGITVPTYVEDYASSEDEIELGQLINQEKVKWLEVKTPQKFDAILIRLKGQPMHCGVYLDNDLFIHCLKGSNVTIESINSVMWKNRILGYYRYEK